MLYSSLMKLARLPGYVQVYCGHEYTASNARFALSVDGGNALLVDRAKDIEMIRAKNAFTLPTTIAIERATNTVPARRGAGSSGRARDAERRRRRDLHRIARAQEPKLNRHG